MLRIFGTVLFCSLISVLAFQTIKLKSQETTSNDQCFNCHEVLDGRLKTPADLFKLDIHFRKGVTCADCHGGISSEEDQDKAMNKSSGFLGVPKGGQVTRICSECHKKQAESFRKSFHGISSKNSGSIIENCIVCHGIHNIVPVKSSNSIVNGANLVKTCTGCHSNAAFMKKYNPGLRIDQLEKYKTSVHGEKVFSGDNKAANCASCHGNHDIKKVKDPNSPVYITNIPSTCNKCHGDANYMKGYNIPTNQLEKFKSSVHGIALLEKGNLNAPSCNKCHGDHGATIPGNESVSKICGQCHTQNAELYEESPHKLVFRNEKKKDCVVCHNNHDISKPGDEMLGRGEKSVCMKCHVQNDKGFIASVEMKNMIDSLLKEVEFSNRSIYFAEQKGMDVSEVKFESNEINEFLILARTKTHYGYSNKFINTLNEAFKITNNAKLKSEVAIEDFYYRRYWLALSFFFSVVIACSLIFKLRRLENKNGSKKI